MLNLSIAAGIFSSITVLLQEHCPQSQYCCRNIVLNLSIAAGTSSSISVLLQEHCPQS